MILDNYSVCPVCKRSVEKGIRIQRCHACSLIGCNKCSFPFSEMSLCEACYQNARDYETKLLEEECHGFS